MSHIRPSTHVFRCLRSSRSPAVRQWHLTSQLRRNATTTSPPPPGYKPRSRIRPYIWIAVFTIGGYAAGKALFGPFNMMGRVEKGSPQDLMVQDVLRFNADKLPVVKNLIETSEYPGSGWSEVMLAEEEGNAVINETLAGGMDYLHMPRAFWNKEQGELVMIVWYGGGLCGWPGIAHGGCTATVLIEGMGRAVACYTGGGQHLAAPDPEHLGLTYLRPVKASGYYILKAKISPVQAQEEQFFPDTGIASEKDLAKKMAEERSSVTARLNKKYEINCVIEDKKGVPCAKAKGVWDIV